MERLDVLIRQVREQTGNATYSNTQGIKQREFVRHANAGQMRIYNKILQERSTLFTKVGYLNVTAGTAVYALPTDVFLKHNLIKVDYSYNGDARNYAPLEMRTPRQEVSAQGYPASYFLRQGQIVLSPIPSQSATAAIRLNYQYTIPTLDIRRAQIDRVDSAEAPIEWDWTTTAAATEAAAYGDGLFVRGGASGALYTSPDAVTWTSRTSGFSSTTIRKIIFANGVFVAIGDSGKISYSADGITWTAATSGVSDRLRDVVYGGGRFVFVGDVGATGFSADNGVTWSNITSGFGAVTITSITYSASLRMYVAVGGGVGTGAARYSYDGQAWQSTTGYSTAIPTSVVCNDACFISGQGTGVVSKSADGVTWTQPTTGLSVVGTAYVTFGDDRFVASGTTGAAYSADGTTWTACTISAGNTLGQVFYREGVFLVQEIAGNSALHVSTNGITFKGGIYLPDVATSFASNGYGTFIQVSTSVRVSVAHTTTYDLVLTSFTDETSADLADGWVDKISIVDSDGVALTTGIVVSSFTDSTGVLNCVSDVSLVDAEDYYIVFGTNATTHSSLPDVCERYLADYMALRIQMRDSSAESADTSPVLGAIEAEILDAIGNLEEDLPSIPILDSSMLNYADDL